MTFLKSLLTLLAIALALLERTRSGRGQHIEVPMFETMAQHVLGDHLGGHAWSPPAGAPGYLRTLNKQRRPYRTSDGHVCVIIYTDRHWRRFLDLVGEPQLYDSDARLRDIGTRTEHSDALTLDRGVFTKSDPAEIARSLKRSAEHSRRRKATPFRSAMSMLTFYINPAGNGLDTAQRKRLEAAKDELRDLFETDKGKD